MMTDISLPKTKTQKNNERKLAELQTEAEEAGRPIPDKIPPTKHAQGRAQKRKNRFARLNLSRFQTPLEAQKKLDDLSEKEREALELLLDKTNRAAKNRRRNARKHV